MRRLLCAVITAGAVAAGLAAGPAAAATTTWTVIPGGAFTNPIARQTRLADLSTHKGFACQPVKMTGTFRSGSGLADPSARSPPCAVLAPARSPAPCPASRS